MDFYVPAARYIGAEQIRRELDDLSFKFLNEEGYKSTKFKMDNYLASKTYDFNASFKEISEL